MARKTIHSLIAGLTLMASAAPSQAIVIFDNGAPDGSTQHRSDLGGVANPKFQVGDEFRLVDGANTINSLRWWGSYTNDSVHDDDFTVRIFEFGLGPRTLPFIEFQVGAASRSDSGQDSRTAGLDIYEYTADLPDTVLMPNFLYLLSIVNDSGTMADWGWSSTAGTAWRRSGATTAEVDATPWNTNISIGMAFSLSGPSPVPAPGTLLLVSAGALALAFRRRNESRRRTRPQRIACHDRRLDLEE